MVVLMLIVVSAGAVAALLSIKNIVYNYQITLSQGDNAAAAFTYGNWPALDNANFYEQVLKNLISQKTTFINADLSTMRLEYYKNLRHFQN